MRTKNGNNIDVEEKVDRKIIVLGINSLNWVCVSELTSSQAIELATNLLHAAQDLRTEPNTEDVPAEEEVSCRDCVDFDNCCPGIDTDIPAEEDFDASCCSSYMQKE